MPGILYVVATPIGNLEDITLRALRILKEADLIAAEDTRHTKKLLTHYGIDTPLTSYYDHIETEKAPALIAQLHEGKTIALVSDAGTPGIADPGYRLVKGAAEAGIPVVPVPGPSTLTALLSIGGLPTDRFAFEGFLPAKPTQRRKTLQLLKQEKRTLVFFESPHRVCDALADIETVFGNRQIVFGRELTKMFEEVLRGRVSEIRARLHDREVKGEVALLVAGAAEEQRSEEAPPLTEEVQYLLAQGLPLKEIAQIVGEHRGISKRDVYAVGLQLKDQDAEKS
ncbi:MAG: 16S rRNA (cytidine(1402)-2'-O)-methyltransferase [Deltaproteobacteria bacterium]|nr:16S rRNA (cytidine(1402)-2'-O)-methyltransferase [Deltaproteobacteria bacterium]